jgi:hypothetical protein
MQPTNRETIELQRLEFEYFGTCVTCGYQFVSGDLSYHGYRSDGSPLYVCEKCSPVLTELVRRTYFTPRAYMVPENAAKLWRYMDFTKYVALLANRKLTFTRADQFTDTHEGAKGLRRNKIGWDTFYIEFFKTAVRNMPGQREDLSDDELAAHAQRLLADLEQGGLNQKRMNFISCWHESDHESEAMWRLYSSFLANAVAITTSYSSLYESLGRNPRIKIGRVEYIDLKSSYVGVNEAFWRKRKSFEHEREVRAIVVEHSHLDIALNIDCDVSILIERVYVSPIAAPWFVTLVNDVNFRFELNKIVSPSELGEEPFF